MVQPRVLIVSNPDYDLHAAAVAEELARRGGDVQYWDPGAAISLGCVFDCQGEGALRLGDIDADGLAAMWYRRPSPILVRDTIEPDYRDIVVEEWKYFIASVWDHLEARGTRLISAPAAIRRAEAKPLQLRLARELGLLVPETIITNDAECFRRFFERHRHRVVCKKLRSHNIITNDRAALFVARLIDRADAIDAESLRLCPVIFQQPVDVALDCRILVIGDRVFAFRIYSREDEGPLDYRADFERLRHAKHEHYEPPVNVAQGCLAMCRALSLSFGAFDFVIDRAGRHIFLELNANGQWLWLQVATGFPLTAAFADYFLS